MSQYQGRRPPYPPEDPPQETTTFHLENVNLRRLTGADKVAGIASFLLLISLFLPWYGVSANGATVTLDPTQSQFQSIVNDVAGFTFAAPTLSAGQSATIIVRMINGASAGTPLFTGMKQWTSVTLDTTSGHEFAIVFYIWAGLFTAYLIQPLSP